MIKKCFALTATPWKANQFHVSMSFLPVAKFHKICQHAKWSAMVKNAAARRESPAILKLKFNHMRAVTAILFERKRKFPGQFSNDFPAVRR